MPHPRNRGGSRSWREDSATDRRPSYRPSRRPLRGLHSSTPYRPRGVTWSSGGARRYVGPRGVWAIADQEPRRRPDERAPGGASGGRRVSLGANDEETRPTPGQDGPPTREETSKARRSLRRAARRRRPGAARGAQPLPASPRERYSWVQDPRDGDRKGAFREAAEEGDHRGAPRAPPTPFSTASMAAVRCSAGLPRKSAISAFLTMGRRLTGMR
jgi:hypothetical protein